MLVFLAAIRYCVISVPTSSNSALSDSRITVYLLSEFKEAFCLYL